MGILNVTPDSFSDGGAHASTQEALAYARLIKEQGADIIDIGGESTRPGAHEVPAREELTRVLPVVRQLAGEGMVVSIDTRHAEVAAACVEAGAAIINDITGFTNPAMAAVAQASTAGLVVMHMQGEPQNMQQEPYYNDVVAQVKAFLLAQAHALEMQGVAHERICLDPGPGFGKAFDHNLALLRATSELAALGAPPYPLMAAWSRKGFIGTLTGEPIPANRTAGSVTAALYAAHHGARILRVHDVPPTAQALKVLAALHG
jgi:dihydropteroate synthase